MDGEWKRDVDVLAVHATIFSKLITVTLKKLRGLAYWLDVDVTMVMCWEDVVDAGTGDYCQVAQFRDEVLNLLRSRDEFLCLGLSFAMTSCMIDENELTKTYWIARIMSITRLASAKSVELAFAKALHRHSKFLDQSRGIVDNVHSLSMLIPFTLLGTGVLDWKLLLTNSQFV